MRPLTETTGSEDPTRRDLKELRRMQWMEKKHDRKHLPEIKEIEERYASKFADDRKVKRSYLKVRNDESCSVCSRMYEEL
jgi:hypothetical protein